MQFQVTHVNDLEPGDKITRFGRSRIATITATEITGKGYQRLYGYLDNETYNPHMVAGHNGYEEKVINV